MRGPRAQRQRYVISVLYLPTDIHSLFVNKYYSSRASTPRARMAGSVYTEQRCSVCLDWIFTG